MRATARTVKGEHLSNSNDRAPATEDVEAVIAHAMRHLGYLGSVAQSTTDGPAARRQAYGNAVQAADALAAALRAEHERARKAEEALADLSRVGGTHGHAPDVEIGVATDACDACASWLRVFDKHRKVIDDARQQQTDGGTDA